MAVRTTITATVRLPGLHCWPGAHEQRAYLRAPHRHQFHVSATLPVSHDERDVEFHDLGDALLEALIDCSAPVPGDGVLAAGLPLRDFGPASCESIARAVDAHLLGLGLTPSAVSVSEDGEFTATIERTTP